MQKFKIIYDEEKAVQEKVRIDAEIPEKNSNMKAKNRIITIVTIALAATFIICTFAGFWYLSTLDLGVTWDILLGFAAMIITVFVGCGLYFFYSNNTYEIMPANDYYTPAIQYHNATENNKILNIETLGNPPWQITLVLEDKDHVVTKEKINLNFAHKLRTDINETIINLDERTIYTPYNKED